MATRATTRTDDAPSPGSASLSRPRLAQSAAGPSLGSTPMRLRESRGPWTWMISAARLGCRNGVIVPRAVPAWHSPGVSANRRGDNGAGYVGELKRQDYVEIPHDRLPCVAFGKSRDGAAHSVYLERHEGVSIGGARVFRWTSAWERYARLGHLTHAEYDHAGKDLFLHQALLDLCTPDGELSPLQIKLATLPLIKRIEAEANHDGPRARALITQMARQLPAEHVPAQVHAILRRLEIELPTDDTDE